MFMSWNGFPLAIRNLLISKLKNKFSTDRPRNNFFDENDTRPKVWVRVPYLGKQGETLIKNCIKKIQRCLTGEVGQLIRRIWPNIIKVILVQIALTRAQNAN
jgi:hypothetical protein